MGIAGRMALWVVPNVQPVTVIIILTAVYIGLYEGVTSAIVIAFLTNILMGSLGPWTLYQAAAWTAVGIITFVFFRNKNRVMPLFIWSIAAAYIYGTVADAFSWQTFSAGSGFMGFLSYRATGLLFDTYHAIGNGVFILVMQPALQKFLSRRENGREII